MRRLRLLHLMRLIMRLRLRCVLCIALLLLVGGHSAVHGRRRSRVGQSGAAGDRMRVSRIRHRLQHDAS